MQPPFCLFRSRDEREKALNVVEKMVILFPNPCPIRREEIAENKELMKQYKGLDARDALH